MADYAISNVPRRVVYANTGVGPYAFTFEILANTDIAVYRGSTLLTLTTDYSVTINANGTGSVTLVTAGTGNITIVGARAIQRTSDYTTGGDLFASTLNVDLDSQTIYAQQVAETAERGLKAPVVDPTDINMTLPAKATRAGTVLAFDSPSGNPIAGPTIAAVGTVSGNIANINTVAGISGNVTTVAGISANVTTVAGVSGNVTTVATNIANVNAVGSDLLEATSEINTVATDIANVNTVGNNISSVNTVAGEIGAGQDVTVVAADLSGSNTIGTVATNIANVNATGTNIANVNAVGADLLEPVSEINTVATDITNVNSVGTNIANVNTVAGISANVTTVAGISANVTSVAGNATNINAVAGNATNINAVAGNSSNINTVATNNANVSTVAGISGNVTTVAGISGNVTTVAGISANVTTVAGISANVTTVATNVADVTNYADTYLGPKTSDPTLRNDSSALQAGDLYFNTVDDVMKVYSGSAWLAAYASLSGALIAANNLSDLASTSAARTNLGLGSSDTPTFAGLTDSGNLTFTGTGNRITGDFSNATIANRVGFQSSTTNGNTDVQVLPNGTAVISGIRLNNNSDLTNAGYVRLSLNSTEANLSVDRNSGSGTYLPLGLNTGGSERLRIDTSGNVGIGTSSPSYKLDVNGVSRVAGLRQTFETGLYTVDGALSNYSSTNGVYLNGNASGWLRLSGDGTNASYVQVVGASAGTAPNTVQFVTASVERMRIDSSGNVGIGTSNPDGKLDISGGGLTSSSIALTNDDNSTISAKYNLTFQADRNNNIGDRAFVWRFGGKGYNDGTAQMQLTQGGVLQFNSGYGSVATAYGCRAWVNFNGTGTVAIRASGNVSSITDNGTGDYTINFSTSMPDVNYSITGLARRTSGSGTSPFIKVGGTYSASAAQVAIFDPNTFSAHDPDIATFAVFR